MGGILVVQKTPQFWTDTVRVKLGDTRTGALLGHLLLAISAACSAAFLILIRYYYHRFHSSSPATGGDDSDSDGGIRYNRDSLVGYQIYAISMISLCIYTQHKNQKSSKGYFTTTSGIPNVGTASAHLLVLWAYGVATLEVLILALALGQYRNLVHIFLHSGGPELIYGVICVSAIVPVIMAWANTALPTSTDVALWCCGSLKPVIVLVMAWVFKGHTPSSVVQVRQLKHQVKNLRIVVV